MQHSLKEGVNKPKHHDINTQSVLCQINKNASCLISTPGHQSVDGINNFDNGLGQKSPPRTLHDLLV